MQAWDIAPHDRPKKEKKIVLHVFNFVLKFRRQFRM